MVKILTYGIGQDRLKRINNYVSDFIFLLEIINFYIKHEGQCQIELSEFVEILDHPANECGHRLLAMEDMKLITSKQMGPGNGKRIWITKLGQSYLTNVKERKKLQSAFSKWAETLIGKRVKVRQQLIRQFPPLTEEDEPLERLSKAEKDHWRHRYQG